MPRPSTDAPCLLIIDGVAVRVPFEVERAHSDRAARLLTASTTAPVKRALTEAWAEGYAAGYTRARDLALELAREERSR